MRTRFDFAELLQFYVNKEGYTTGQLSKRSGIPKPTIVNWLEGRVRRPRSWQDLVSQPLRLLPAGVRKVASGGRIC